MTPTWTLEQILALAPDASSARAANSLTGARHWLALGHDTRTAWGECQGSAADPYQTCIELAGPTFHCSCPSRKFPCKHGLALGLTFVREPQAFQETSTPAWVTEWLDARAKRAAQAAQPKPTTGKAKRDPKAQARRAAQRETKVVAGLDELQRWLLDLIRNGLATIQTQPYSFWEAHAARLIDAQAPGLARRVRELPGLAASGEGWQGRLLAGLARLHLLIEGYQQLESLPPDTQADIRAAIGWTIDQDELLVQPGVNDRWLVLGQRVIEEDRLRVLRTWLWGQDTRRPALVLQFAQLRQALEIRFLPGSIYEADLVFYPGAFPLRALVQRHAAPRAAEVPVGLWVSEAIETYAQALTQNPWLEQFPLVLRDVIPLRRDEDWVVRDTSGKFLPLAPRDKSGWQLYALSGGPSLTLFGEWDGEYLLPLSVWAEGRFVQLKTGNVV